MSPDKQRIAIAIACGWKYTDNDPKRYPYWLAPKADFRYGNPLDANLFPGTFPDYLTDLNAMHEAENVLMHADLIFEYGMHITTDHHYEHLLRATAAQRAEAFLRTIGKWEGAK